VQAGVFDSNLRREAKGLRAVPKRRDMRKFQPLKLVLIALLVVLSGSLCRAQAALAGEWEGTISTPGGDMHLAWHVTAAADGTITSTFDNKDQGVMGIKSKVTEFKDSKLLVTVEDQIEVNGSAVNLRGTVEGTVSADGTELTGNWTQTDPEAQGPMELHLKRAGGQAAAPAAAAPKN
jgi:hypothetical protein